MDFYTACERLGFPVVLLLGIGYMLYAVLGWLGKEVVKPIADSHIALVESTKATQMTNAETLKKVGSVLEDKAGTLIKIEKQNDQILELTNKNHELLEGIKKQQEPEA